MSEQRVDDEQLAIWLDFAEKGNGLVLEEQLEVMHDLLDARRELAEAQGTLLRLARWASEAIGKMPIPGGIGVIEAALNYLGSLTHAAAHEEE